MAAGPDESGVLRRREAYAWGGFGAVCCSARPPAPGRRRAEPPPRRQPRSDRRAGGDTRRARAGGASVGLLFAGKAARWTYAGGSGAALPAGPALGPHHSRPSQAGFPFPDTPPAVPAPGLPSPARTRDCAPATPWRGDPGRSPRGGAAHPRGALPGWSPRPQADSERGAPRPEHGRSWGRGPRTQELDSALVGEGDLSGRLAVSGTVRQAWQVILLSGSKKKKIRKTAQTGGC